MYILKGKDIINEMSQHWVNSAGELPFDVVVQSPEHLPPHAHILDANSGKEIGQFLIPSKLPKTPEEIKDYKKGISDTARNQIFNWISRPNKRLFKRNSNWEMLVALWNSSKK